MKKLIFASFVLVSSIIIGTGCKKKETATEVIPDAAIKTVTNADANEKIYFNLTTGEFVSKDELTNDNWDISFYAEEQDAQIAVNSGNNGDGSVGIILLNEKFTNVRSAPESGYLSGDEATPNFTTWANYTANNEPLHAVLPKEDVTLVVKTAAGKYSKVQILSLYEGNPNTASEEFKNITTRPAFGFYTFRYATQQGNYSKF